MAAANNSIVETMNKDLLNKTKALVEALEDDTELAAEVTDAALGDEGGAGAPMGDEGALPPPPADELGDMPPEAGMDGMEGGAPEDEALGLLRDIAGGIDRLANELAPMEAPEGGMPGEEGGEPEEPEGEEKDDEGEEKSEEPGVPPVEDDDDFNETMPVASGA